MKVYYVHACICLYDVQIHRMCTDSAVFSTCSVVHLHHNKTSGVNLRVLSGSHDKYVYCWDGNCELVWKLQLDSEVYSTPCVCSLRSHKQKTLEPSHPPISMCDQPDVDVAEQDLISLSEIPCVCVCSSAGCLYLLNFSTGHLISSYCLPGEVFSSPVVIDNSIIVGCRDDYVYCINIKLI